MWKCSSCIGSPIYCHTCCLTQHRRTPFHRVEQWRIEGYWAPAWLKDVGLCINLGHRGAPCPVPEPFADIDDDDEERPAEEEENDPEAAQDDPLRHADPPPRPPASMMTIVDTTGVHFLPVRWCGCAGAASHTSQLLDCGLYPASQRAARTCFTFTVLDDFLLDNLECKTTAMNYYRRLRRVTDPVFPHEVPVSVRFSVRGASTWLTRDKDRYLELLRVSREWTLLQAKKEHGYGPAWRGVPGDGDLANFCAACPQPGVNIPHEWQADDRE